MGEEEDGIFRLNKYLSQAGCGSRKETATLIKKSLVTVNGDIVTEPFYQVKPDDIVKLRNKVIIPKVTYTYVLINKSQRSPILADEKNEVPSLQDQVQKWNASKLLPLNHPTDACCGLVIMTNDSDLQAKLAVSGHRIKSVFEITLDSEINKDQLDIILKQPNIGGARILGLGFPDENEKRVLGLELIGGNFSDVYQMMNSQGLKIQKLDCMFYGGLTKKDLKRGWSRLLTEKEEIFIKHFS